MPHAAILNYVSQKRKIIPSFFSLAAHEISLYACRHSRFIKVKFTIVTLSPVFIHVNYIRIQVKLLISYIFYMANRLVTIDREIRYLLMINNY